MEGDAGTGRLNPTPDDEVTPEEYPTVAAEGPVDSRRPSRLGVGLMAGVCAALVLLAGGAAVGGYFALRSADEAKAIARADTAALEAAKTCVTATQAPDAEAITASQAKIIECATGDFATQASLYAGVLVDAYQAANVTVQVSDLRAAVERHHDDGSIDVLVAVRVMVTNSQVADQEQGYRLRVKMAPDDGEYKIAQLDQVTS